MKLKDWLEKWELEKFRVNVNFLQAELKFNDVDKKAAWEMYIELLTRVTTQNLPAHSGLEQTALTSVFSLFATTRKILKENGPKALEFSKIAIIVLNQTIRPFTAKWHKLSNEGAFENDDSKIRFREELKELQESLRKYAGLLSEIAGVEDLGRLEN